MLSSLLYIFFWIFIHLDVLTGLILIVTIPAWFIATRQNKAAYQPKILRRVSLVSIVLFCIINVSPLGPWMLLTLENVHTRPLYPESKALPHSLLDTQTRPSASYPLKGMIVLGGSLSLQETREKGEAVYNLSGTRVFQAVHLAQTLKTIHPDMKVILTGNQQETANAAQLFTQAGFSKNDLVLENQSQSTHDHARLLKPFLDVSDRQTPHYLLVTSAFHMPRAVMLFEHMGVPVIPYPVDYHTPGRMSFMFWIATLFQRLSPIAFKQACLELAGMAQLKLLN